MLTANIFDFKGANTRVAVGFSDLSILCQPLSIRNSDPAVAMIGQHKDLYAVGVAGWCRGKRANMIEYALSSGV